MKKHKIEKTAPRRCPVPKNIPDDIPKFKTIVADPPWGKNQSHAAEYGGAIGHYNLMSLDRIKQMPVADIADDDAHLYLWITNSNIDEGLEVIKAWGFRYITMFHWIKPKMGTGNFLRSASETCLFAVRGSLPPQNRSQINWFIGYPTVHSEKPREFISVVERVSPGPYLELFCRRRPATYEKWYCWGNETEGGADLFIPSYPVPKYSFEQEQEREQTRPAKAKSQKVTRKILCKTIKQEESEVNKKQMERIMELRKLNYSYAFIARVLSLNVNTVKSVCRRNGYTAEGSRKTKAEKESAALCKNCYKPLTNGRKDAKFCSVQCRTAWWRGARRVVRLEEKQ